MDKHLNLIEAQAKEENNQELMEKNPAVFDCIMIDKHWLFMMRKFVEQLTERAD